MIRLTFVVAALALMAGAACYQELPPDRTSGPDKDRAGAKEISIGATIIDDVDPLAGDSTDWKYVTIPGPGIITVSISFDNPKALGEMAVTDQRGQVQSVYNDEARGILDNITFKGETGQYYMRISASAESSSYTVEVTYEAL